MSSKNVIFVSNKVFSSESKKKQGIDDDNMFTASSNVIFGIEADKSISSNADFYDSNVSW